ncbi:MAG: hypothetical protein CVU62_10445 [Deltaproteobacteria bacterium HGW-Deltaproteobacteria-2]|jgi:uncharacterized membrane protein|nr:MAG: hypothetical protein CVU62_10445 [Deltaproteobacteria bacterium HGW-Deltaproteobacteria-2]
MNIFNQSAIAAKKSPFIYRDQATLEMRSGGGCISIFGLPFLLVGIFIMQIPLGIIPVQRSGTLPAIFVVLIGCVFAAVGACLVFGRSGIILDRGRGSIIQWYGLLVPMKRTEYLLESVGQVEINFASGDSKSAATWPVTIASESIAKPISVSQPTSFIEARQVAEELARFLRKPLVDYSTGEKVTHDPEHLDESYRDRVRRTGEAVSSLPPEPPNIRSQVERTGEGLIINIPALANSRFQYIPVYFSLIFAGGVAWFFLRPILMFTMPEFIRNIFLGFFGLFFIAVPVISALRTVYRRKKEFERITVTKTFLRLEALKQGKSITMEIPTAELEDLVAPTTRGAMNTIEVSGMKKVSLGDTGTPRMPDGRPVPRFLVSLMKMVGSRGITARSDKTFIGFATGLDEAEVTWLFALIRKTIAE